MSRIGKKPIVVPEKTEVNISENEVRVKGPLGELSKTFRPSDVSIVLSDGSVIVSPKRDTKISRSLWGAYASHIQNMVSGVNKPFVKELIVEGVGYRVELQGKELVLSVGFSHKVTLTIPEGLDVSVEKNKITVSGSNKELVGQFCASARAVKKPEPYKGKGIRYSDEIPRRKQGKRAVA